MILSTYSKIYQSPEDPDSFILFSTKKASIIQVTRSFMDDLSAGRLTPEEAEDLANLGFLVENVEEEKREMLGFVEELNGLRDKLAVTLVMNLDCNLDCTYCFEGARKGSHYMTKETADRIIDYITRSQLRGISRLAPLFYGGEPLLSLDLVEYISGRLKSFAERGGLSYGAAIVTNGTLLTPSVARRLKASGIWRAGVTLDGPRETHDLARPFKSGNGSFDLIFRNVKDAASILDIQIGGNYTAENYRSFPLLMNHMVENGITPEMISEVRFDFVMQEREGIAPPDFRHGCETINELWIFEAGIYLREETLKRGFRTGRMTPAACAIEFDNGLVVNYDGGFYKCTGFLGRNDCKVGDPESGMLDYRASHNLDNWKNEECLGCAYLPLCFGGCRYMKYIRDGNMNGVDCKKPYLDATLEAVVKQDIKYRVM